MSRLCDHIIELFESQWMIANQSHWWLVDNVEKDWYVRSIFRNKYHFLLMSVMGLSLRFAITFAACFNCIDLYSTSPPKVTNSPVISWYVSHWRIYGNYIKGTTQANMSENGCLTYSLNSHVVLFCLSSIWIQFPVVMMVYARLTKW